MPSGDDNGIGLVTFGEVDREDLSFLPQVLREITGLTAHWYASLPLPSGSYEESRGQYFSPHLLLALEKLPDSRYRRLLGLADADLFTRGLNFIFGQAVIGGRECLISLARLRPSFYGEPENTEIFRERVVKEAVHELGHTFGLSHCKDPGCVMRFSNSLQETDFKGRSFCSQCWNKLQSS